MATLAQTECREVCDPEKCRSIQARKKHKEKTLRDNPDVFQSREGERRDHVNCTDSEEEGPVNPTPSPSERQLRGSLALLELDFTEFRERTQAKLPDAHNTNIYIQE
ncbi:hypothetical protein QQF64_023526 [Cirrhinus molitorella]|uniref:Uncharacterized protein n=1 Tax=Cirrhinus molitorella TaxID=172907 RepID=A0ABR3L5E5_9TELE